MERLCHKSREERFILSCHRPLSNSSLILFSQLCQNYHNIPEPLLSVISRDRGWKENMWVFANFRKSILSVPTSVLFHFKFFKPSSKSLKLVFKQTVTDGAMRPFTIWAFTKLSNLLSHSGALGWRQKELRTTTSSSLLSDFSPQTTFSCRAKELGGYSTISIGLLPRGLWSPPHTPMDLFCKLGKNKCIDHQYSSQPGPTQ